MMKYDVIFKFARQFELKVLAIGMSLQEAEGIMGLSGKEYDKKELNKAYFKLISKNHPDINKSPDALEKTKHINLAYERLKAHLALKPKLNKDLPIDFDDYDLKEKEKPDALTFKINRIFYPSKTRSYVPDGFREKFLEEKHLPSIREVISYIENEMKAGPTNEKAFLVQAGNGSRQTVVGLVKFDHIDQRWFVVPPAWHPKSDDDMERDDKNPHRSWDEVKYEWINQFDEQFLI